MNVLGWDIVYVASVCVHDGWLKQLHLARVRLIGLWGRVRLHTCYTSKQQPRTRTQGGSL